MAVSKLTCPECETVLRPAKPLAPGKRVKCPNCSATFQVPFDEEDEELPVPKASTKKKAAPPPPPPPKKKEEPKQGGLEYETSTYAVIKTEEDLEETEKEDRGDEMVAELLKVSKTKDPRGPAMDVVTRPSNYLIFTGAAGTIAWVLLLLLTIVLNLMPPPSVDDLEDDGKRKRYKTTFIGPGVAVVNNFDNPFKNEVATAESGFEKVFTKQRTLASENPALFILVCLFCLIGIAYGVLTIYGAVKTQNLVERGWGIASSILAMIPINTLAFYSITGALTLALFSFLYDDGCFIAAGMIFLGLVELGWGIGVGIWNLMALNDTVVIEGYEYDENAEEQEEDEDEDEDEDDEDDEEEDDED